MSSVHRIEVVAFDIVSIIKSPTPFRTGVLFPRIRTQGNVKACLTWNYFWIGLISKLKSLGCAFAPVTVLQKLTNAKKVNTWTVVKASFIIVSITVSSWTVSVNRLYILGVDDRTASTLLRWYWWCWTAHVDPRCLGFWQTQTIGRRKIPSLARWETGNYLQC